MKIIIDESDTYEELTVVVQCKKCDEEILELIARMKAENEKIMGSLDEKAFVLEPKDILYFESVDKKTFIYTTKEVYETSLRLYEIEKILRLRGFFRSSKSTILNIGKIKSIRASIGSTLMVALENGEQLGVSRQYAPILRERLGK